MILTKIAGVGCILAGFFFVVYLVESSEMQTPTFTNVFVFFGIFLILLGIYLLKV